MSEAIERLAAELASWTGAESAYGEGWCYGETPKGDEPAPRDYPDLAEYERRMREQHAPYFQQCEAKAARRYVSERAAWLARAEKVMRALGLVAVPAELVERVRLARDGADEMMVNRWLADAVLEQLGGGR